MHLTILQTVVLPDVTGFQGSSRRFIFWNATPRRSFGEACCLPLQGPADKEEYHTTTLWDSNGSEPWCKADHSPTSYAQAKDEWTYTSILPIRLHKTHIHTHTHTKTFTLMFLVILNYVLRMCYNLPLIFILPVSFINWFHNRVSKDCWVFAEVNRNTPLGLICWITRHNGYIRLSPNQTNWNEIKKMVLLQFRLLLPFVLVCVGSTGSVTCLLNIYVPRFMFWTLFCCAECVSNSQFYQQLAELCRPSKNDATSDSIILVAVCCCFVLLSLLFGFSVRRTGFYWSFLWFIIHILSCVA